MHTKYEEASYKAAPLFPLLGIMHLEVRKNIHMTFLPEIKSHGIIQTATLGIFLLTPASRPALGPSQPPIQWVPGIFSLVIKRPGGEADRSPPSSAEVKNPLSYTPTPPLRLHGVVLSLKKKAQGQLYLLPFTFYV
jgi:hypothetical protein